MFLRAARRALAESLFFRTTGASSVRFALEPAAFFRDRVFALEVSSAEREWLVK
jgi:hypothetical protein